VNEDLKHLNLLSIFHYVVGALSALFSCMFLIYLLVGLIMVISPESMISDSGEIPPAFAGYLLIIIGGLFFLFGVGVSTCIIVSGRFLGRRKKHLFSFVMACIECLFMPFGTVLGIFTIIVLSKDSVKALYSLEAPGN
jgi:hypothetical protein